MSRQDFTDSEAEVWDVVEAGVGVRAGVAVGVAELADSAVGGEGVGVGCPCGEFGVGFAGAGADAGVCG